MKLLQTISDGNFFPDKPDVPIKIREVVRTAVRAILRNDEGKIALVGETYLVLPGGGQKAGESLEDTIRREILEEIGCEITIVDEVGKICEEKNSTGEVQESYCYNANILKEGTPKATEVDEKGMELRWCTPTEALHILDTEYNSLTANDYHAYFNIEVSRIFLKAGCHEILQR
jgi:ADP-ribose pyrophosphatase YjhB (NUDIX family)